MTQTPIFMFNKKVFAWAVDTAWDFKMDLFDYIARIKPGTGREKLAFQKLETIVSGRTAIVKSNIEKDSANLYLATLALYCYKNPDSLQTKAFIDLWKSIYLLFPNKQRALEPVPAFKCLLTVKDLFASTKAQYYIMHAFAYNTSFTRQDDYKRALTLLVNNPNATVTDLKAVLDVRDDMDEKIARAIVEKCYSKVVELEKKPEKMRNNRPSGNKDYSTKYAYKIKSICQDGILATRILLNINLKYAMEMKTFFEKAMERAKTKPVEDEPKVVMPDINDLTQFPNYARLLSQVKEQERKK